MQQEIQNCSVWCQQVDSDSDGEEIIARKGKTSKQAVLDDDSESEAGDMETDGPLADDKSQASGEDDSGAEAQPVSEGDGGVKKAGGKKAKGAAKEPKAKESKAKEKKAAKRPTNQPTLGKVKAGSVAGESFYRHLCDLGGSRSLVDENQVGFPDSRYLQRRNQTQMP